MKQENELSSRDNMTETREKNPQNPTFEKLYRLQPCPWFYLHHKCNSISYVENAESFSFLAFD